MKLFILICATINSLTVLRAKEEEKLAGYSDISDSSLTKSDFEDYSLQSIYEKKPILSAKSPRSLEAFNNYIENGFAEQNLTSEEQFELSKPDLVCILFDDFGCNASCFLIATLYNQTGIGVCKLNQCKCQYYRSPNVTFQDIWNEIFEPTPYSKKFLNNFDKTPNFKKQVMSVFNTTGIIEEVYKQKLINKFPGIPDFEELQARDSYVIHDFLHDDGTVKFPQLEQYYTYTLNPILEQNAGRIMHSKYQTRFEEFAKNNEGKRMRIYLIESSIKTNNPTIIDIVFKFYKDAVTFRTKPGPNYRDEILLVPEVARNIVSKDFVAYIVMIEEFRNKKTTAKKNVDFLYY